MSDEEEEEAMCEFSGEGVVIPTEGGCLPGSSNFGEAVILQTTNQH
jgi:hypothetical protein